MRTSLPAAGDYTVWKSLCWWGETFSGAKLPWVWTQVGLESKNEEWPLGEGEILGEGTNHEGN